MEGWSGHWKSVGSQVDPWLGGCGNGNCKVRVRVSKVIQETGSQGGGIEEAICKGG